MLKFQMFCQGQLLEICEPAVLTSIVINKPASKYWHRVVLTESKLILIFIWNHLHAYASLWPATNSKDHTGNTGWPFYLCLILMYIDMFHSLSSLLQPSYCFIKTF